MSLSSTPPRPAGCMPRASSTAASIHISSPDASFRISDIAELDLQVRPCTEDNQTDRHRAVLTPRSRGQARSGCRIRTRVAIGDSYVRVRDAPQTTGARELAPPLDPGSTGCDLRTAIVGRPASILQQLRSAVAEKLDQSRGQIRHGPPIRIPPWSPLDRAFRSDTGSRYRTRVQRGQAPVRSFEHGRAIAGRAGGIP